MKNNKIFLIGYPGDLGGANVEAWHTIKLWRKFGLDVHLIPTWGKDDKWLKITNDIGCTTHFTTFEDIDKLECLKDSIVVGFCNDQFLKSTKKLKSIGCRLVWLNCMTWLFDYERSLYKDNIFFDAFVFQSDFQRTSIEESLKEYNYDTEHSYTIHGAFDFDDWAYNPRRHGIDDPFYIGKAARPDLDKWSSNLWLIYNNVQYADKRALLLGVDDRTMAKLGPTPSWGQIIRPLGITSKQFFSALHCLLPINGGARENWPRIGLEAMASGVPIVINNDWGWKEMVINKKTGFLCNNDNELSHFTACLAYDEELRIYMAREGRKFLVNDLANPEIIWSGWNKLIEDLK